MGIGIDLFFVRRSELTSYFCGVEIVFLWGRKSLGFSAWIEIDLIACVVEIDVISVWGIGFDLISV